MKIRIFATHLGESGVRDGLEMGRGKQKLYRRTYGGGGPGSEKEADFSEREVDVVTGRRRDPEADVVDGCVEV